MMMELVVFGAVVSEGALDHAAGEIWRIVLWLARAVLAP
jgi:hypothetical protein